MRQLHPNIHQRFIKFIRISSRVFRRFVVPPPISGLHLISLDLDLILNLSRFLTSRLACWKVTKQVVIIHDTNPNNTLL